MLTVLYNGRDYPIKAFLKNKNMYFTKILMEIILFIKKYANLQSGANVV